MVRRLAPFFDLAVAQEPAVCNLWFHNLHDLARQNLGLAHCVLHNQTARNTSALKGLTPPYADSVGSYHFHKPGLDTMILQGSRLHGRAYWTSQLHNADYVVMRVQDDQACKRWVFVDLRCARVTISPSRFGVMGMPAARASDLELDMQVPDAWILDLGQDCQDLVQASNFYSYGLITNYLGVSQSLLDHMRDHCDRHKIQVTYDLDKFQLQIDMAHLGWRSNLHSVHLRKLDRAFWHARDTQYAFGKKILADQVGFYLQIFATRFCDVADQESQVFRDALVMCSHITNLYKKLQHAEYQPGPQGRGT